MVLNASCFMFSLKIETMGAVSPVIPLSNKKTAPLPLICCEGIPVVSTCSFDLIKIGKLK